QVIGKKIIYYLSEKIYILSTDNAAVETLTVPFDLKEIQQVYFKENRIYVARSDEIQIFQQE
ncbi:MAG: hypothetical protein AAF960_18990, partial [Bacteroidota bacterium]